MSKIKITILLTFLILLILEVASFYLTTYTPFFKKIEYQRLRGALSGSGEGGLGSALSKYLATPYLGVTLNPRYKNEDGIKIHNDLGYRGKEYSLTKPDHVYRIICLGGSTTYGFNVNNNETYPYQLERKLNRFIKNKELHLNMYDSIQVINAGIEGGKYVSRII